MKLYFPDTNLFFECRKATDLPWHELEGVAPAAATEVRLIVPSPVITEIDRHKQKGNSRTAKRAREASALLRRALLSADHTVEVRSANPPVNLSLPTVVRTDPAAHPTLDPSRADHRIILEYLELIKTEPNLRILTDDTLLILSARSVGLDPILIPEGWKLGAEKDERDDELDQVKAELKTLKQNAPELVFAVQDVQGADISSIGMPVPVFGLSAAEIDAAVVAVAAAFPIATDFRERPSATDRVVGSFDLMRQWRPPRPEEIERYKNELYPNWREGLQRALPRLASRITDAASEAIFTVSVSNSGYVNATSVRLTIEGFDGALVHDPLDKDELEEREKSLLLPRPPDPPRGGYVTLAHSVTPIMPIMPRDYSSMLRPRERDPSSFYYVDRPQMPSEALQLTCEALPHQSSAHRLNFRVRASYDELGAKPRVRVRIEASNLRKPIEKYLAVSVDVQPTTFKDQLEKMLGFPI